MVGGIFVSRSCLLACTFGESGLAWRRYVHSDLLLTLNLNAVALLVHQRDRTFIENARALPTVQGGGCNYTILSSHGRRNSVDGQDGKQSKKSKVELHVCVASLRRFGKKKRHRAISVSVGDDVYINVSPLV
jgi:hypothetical protein